jgi:transcriptional regulator of arginine metabolism
VKKSERLEIIRSIIEDQQIETQEELLNRLKISGVTATQATISRDIRELGVVKARGENGRTSYQIVNNLAPTNEQQFHERFEDVALTMNRVEFMIVIKTALGSANMIAALLDELDYTEVLGTLAGADTIMITCRSVEDAIYFEENLRKYM